jgi:hypothetical protein
MAQKNQQKVAVRAETHSTGKKIGHWVRVGVMFLSGGFVFPHAMTENDDARDDAKRDTDKMTR